MGNKPAQGEQIQTIPFGTIYVQESFDLNRLDAFVKGLGTTFYHWKAVPSPIGLNDRGDYRRNDGVDVITSNGYVYHLAGQFTATMTNNQKDQSRPSEGGLFDTATAYLVLPRFYDSQQNNFNCNSGQAQQQRIRLTVGDRLYSDPQADDLVVNKELMTYSLTGIDVPMFPIKAMDGPVIDSLGNQYQQNVNFNITPEGNIEWIVGQAQPGIDPDTGQGRTYSIRYLYRAFYYVTSLIREVRITNVTYGATRSPERMAMFIQLQREYLYHGINRGSELNPPPQKGAELRQTPEAPVKIDINQPVIRVETTDYNNDE
jgi:hypothetical protein